MMETTPPPPCPRPIWHGNPGSFFCCLLPPSLGSPCLILSKGTRNRRRSFGMLCVTMRHPRQNNEIADSGQLFNSIRLSIIIRVTTSILCFEVHDCSFIESIVWDFCRISVPRPRPSLSPPRWKRWRRSALISSISP